MVPDQKDEDMRWMLASAGIIVISLLIQFYVTQCGLLLTYDSREYLSAAGSFAERHVFTGTDGTSFVFWPPLFPMLLSLFSDPQGAMVWINLVMSAIIGVLLSQLATRHLNYIGLRIGFLSAWMCGIHQLLISVFLWSELLFLLLLMLFAWLIVRSTNNWLALAGAFVVGFLLCLERNAGLFVVPAGALWFVLRGEEPRSVRSALIILLAMSGGLWWNITNMYGPASTTVSNLDYFSFVFNNILVVTDGIAQSILPFRILSIPFAIIIVASPVALMWPSRKLSDHFLLMTLICCFYLAGMAVLPRLDHGDADRYAAIILPFLLLTVFRVIENAFSTANKRIRTVLLIAMLAWLSYPLLRTVKNAVQWHAVNCAVDGPL